MRKKLEETKSLCPECFEELDAEIVEVNKKIYLEKECEEHGKYQTLIWNDNAESWKNWDLLNDWEPDFTEGDNFNTEEKKGCPLDCGLCPEHLRRACFVVLEVTDSCNLNCPICFADSAGKNQSYEPSLETIEEMYKTILEYESKKSTPSIQISGGEPTVRSDLPEIVSMGKEIGFNHLMVNTNGIKIAKDPSFLKELKKSGLDSIYLSFDGTTNEVYEELAGEPILEYKEKALENCSKYEIDVVLVPTIKKGVNLKEMGSIIRTAKEWIQTVDGIMFQPISYFGRYPDSSLPKNRLTTPDVLRSIEKQVNGLKKQNFVPLGYAKGCEAHCGFSCLAIAKENELIPVTRFPSKGDIETINETRKDNSSKHLRKSIKSGWKTETKEKEACELNPTKGKGLKENVLSISGMLFQDAWNTETRRLKKCCIHVVTPQNKLIPFCAFNMTNKDGETLYRNKQLYNG